MIFVIIGTEKTRFWIIENGSIFEQMERNIIYETNS
jgi:hypothetical protein